MDSPTRVYITGADGMAGTALMDVMAGRPESSSWPVLGVSLADFDIGDSAAVAESIEQFAPDVVVHLAATAIVDVCEANPAIALRVNVAGTRNVARGARAAGARLVYVSSDYVFDGSDTPPGGYTESDLPDPLSIYGLTKLGGERIVQAVPQHLVVRTSWLFGGRDPATDQVLAMIALARSGERLEMIADQVSCPTHVADLAEALHFLIRTGVTGTIHAAGAEPASWYEVGTLVLDELADTLPGRNGRRPLLLDESHFLGARPRDSALNSGALRELGHRIPGWRESVGRFCHELSLSAHQPQRPPGAS